MFSSLARVLNIAGNLPTAEWFKEIKDQYIFTPDLPLLEKRPYHWLFEYGELQPKHSLFDLKNMAEDLPVRNGRIVPPMAAFTLNSFSGYKQKLGKMSHPVALLEPHFNTLNIPVKGTLMGIRSSRFIDLDFHRLNGVAFQRHRVKVQVPHIKHIWSKEAQGTTRIVCEPAILSAWMYIGISSYWKEMLDNGFTTSKLNSFGDLSATIPQYYQFTRRDYDE
jgi:hypothetical protein